ncbi:MAG: hypothetical protein H9917_08950 [Candidatus Oceanisphaera merdipullorum]|nr:hypothetical protein [Candidatus Oceanisphaera merdipullorum]
MKIFVKIMVVLFLSVPTYASELSYSKAFLQDGIDNDFIGPLTSISESLDTLANTTVQLSTSDHAFSDKYKELHVEVLKSIALLNETIAQDYLVNENNIYSSNDGSNLKERVDALYKNQSYFTYADFAAIAITSVSVLITIIGIVIAVLSFWGYKNIISKTESSARNVAEKVAGETTENKIDDVVKCKLKELIDEGRFTKHLEDVVDTFILRNKSDEKDINWSELDESIDWDDLIENLDNIKKQGGKS